MDKNENYASDSDESDEDFCPDKATAGDSVSEEEEDEADSSSNCEFEDALPKTKKRQINNNKSNKRVKRSRKQADSSSDESVQEQMPVVNAAANGKSRITRQRDTGTNGSKAALEKDELESDDEDDTRTAALYADFLREVPGTSNVSRAQTNNMQTKITKTKTATNDGEIMEKVAAAVEQMPKESAKRSIKENKLSPAIISVPSSMRSLSRVAAKLPAAAAGSAGLGSVLNQLGKKKKSSVLEKSKLDWSSFKEDEGIDEELQTFNKGKDGYLERQDFLQRTDLRQFEIEKNMRQSSRRTL